MENLPESIFDLDKDHVDGIGKPEDLNKDGLCDDDYYHPEFKRPERGPLWPNDDNVRKIVQNVAADWDDRLDSPGHDYIGDGETVYSTCLRTVCHVYDVKEIDDALKDEVRLAYLHFCANNGLFQFNGPFRWKELNAQRKKMGRRK